MTQPDARIPVTLLTGFLGSGKTTRLNAILRDSRFADAAVIVNELGDIGLDHLLVAKSEDNIVLLNSGCLCCTVLNTFKDTLADLYERRARGDVPAFARVFIETTGLADPAPILQCLLKDSFVAHYYRLDQVVTTVDALLADSTFDVHPEAVKQAAVADLILLTKTDLTGGTCPPGLFARLKVLNPTATLVALAPGQVPDFAPGRMPHVPEHDHDHDYDHDHDHGHDHDSRHDHAVAAHSFVIDHPVSWAGLAGWCELVREAFGDNLLRCKGLIEIAETGKPVLVQGVQRVFASPERLPAWPSADHRSRLVCITKGVDANALTASLAALKAEPGTYRPTSLAELMPART